jgi:CheY-like chemotaxis protein
MNAQQTLLERYPAATRFVVLVVDDEEEPRQEIKRQFEEAPRIEVVEADTTLAASQVLQERYIDAVILDMMIETINDGKEVIRELGRLAPDCTVLIATQLDDVASTVVGTTRPRITGIVTKGELDEDWAPKGLASTISKWRDREMSVRGADLVVDYFDDRDTRERIPSLRARDQLAVEVGRLTRAIFGAVRGIGEPVQVALRPIDTEGLSPAVTVIADVRMGKDYKAEDLPDAVTVLKVGPVADIEAEVDRYETVVKYGVRLTHRVELLGYASAQTLGAISYSFAGGIFGVALTNMNELLRSPTRDEIVDSALENLFQASSRNWYRVALRPVPPTTYFRGEGNLKIKESYERLEGSLRKLRNRFPGKISYDPPGDRLGQITVDNVKLAIPPAGMWRRGPFVPALDTCLVHGDMHAGNVMVELAESAEPDSRIGLAMRRVCLIDYQQAGRGPRMMDFVALEGSVRKADVQQIVAHYGHSDENDLSDDELFAALKVAAERARLERELLVSRFRDGAPPTMPERWQRWVLRLDEMAHWNHSLLQPSEYLTVAALYALRQMSSTLTPLTRVRLLAWLTAVTAELNAGGKR